MYIAHNKDIVVSLFFFYQYLHHKETVISIKTWTILVDIIAEVFAYLGG